MLKREINITDMECVFCGYKEMLKTHEGIKNDDTGFSAGEGIDYWECPCCGEENDTNSECFKEESKPYKKYIEIEDWEGLLFFCASEGFDDFVLESLAKQYLQKKEFNKAINIAKALLELEPDNWLPKELIDKITNKDSKKRINVSFDDIHTGFASCTVENRYFLDIKHEKIVLNSDHYQDKVLKAELENNPENFIAIPMQDSKEEYHLLESFIHEVGEHQGKTTIAQLLRIAITQTEPVIRFKEALIKYPSVQKQWDNFRNGVYKEYICNWLREHNLICKNVD